MDRYSIYVILILCGLVGVLIGSAWIHSIFLIFLTLGAILFGIWVLWKFRTIQARNSRISHSRTITMTAHQKADLQYQRDTLWREILAQERGDNS